MLRRNLREAYRNASPSQDRKDAMLQQVLDSKPDPQGIRGRKWRPRGQAGSWILIILALLVLLGACLYAAWQLGGIAWIHQKWAAYQAARPTTEPTTEATEPTPPSAETTEETVPTKAGDPYADVIRRYRDAIRQDWDAARCEEEGVSYMASFLDAPGKLGYALMDLDADGTQELIITDGSVIYGLYTQNEQGLVHLFSGAERNSYALSAYNIIVNVGSDGAASTIYTFYRYSKGNLIVDQQIIFDAQRDAQNPWFRGFGDPQTSTPISETDAKAIIDSLPPVNIKYEPITTYPES